MTRKIKFAMILFFLLFFYLLAYNFQNHLSYIDTNKLIYISTPTILKFLSFTNSKTTITRLANKVSSLTIGNNSEILCENISKTNLQINNTPTNPCEQIRCNVLLRSSAGRLGNRMFMFASAYGLARSQNCRLYVSNEIRRELENNFQMKIINKQMWLEEEDVKKLEHSEKKYTVCSYFPELLQLTSFKNLELTGFWQSYHYFDGYREEIREFFRPRNDTLKLIAKYLTNIVQDICSSCSPISDTSHDELRQTFRTRTNITWISIHIRRTDFNSIGYVSDENYIHQAISFYRKRYYQNDVRFLVASDDRSYCHRLFVNEKSLKKIFILPDRFSPSEDLLTLAFCHHSIITGGTFGFWTGYLASGDVLHDVKYRFGCSRTEYFPSWFLLIGPLPKQKKS